MNKTKRSIFEAAIKVFSECGYNGAAMDEIALRAGVAKGTLYYYFKSKEEIFKFTITEGMNSITERIEIATSIEKNPIEKLKTFCRVELSLFCEHRDFFKVVMSQLWGQESRQVELRAVIQNYIKYLEKFVQSAMDSGFIKKGEASFIAYTIFGTVSSTAVYELLNEHDTNVEEVTENIMNYILKGIGI